MSFRISDSNLLFVPKDKLRALGFVVVENRIEHKEKTIGVERWIEAASAIATANKSTLAIAKTVKTVVNKYKCPLAIHIKTLCTDAIKDIERLQRIGHETI